MSRELPRTCRLHGILVVVALWLLFMGFKAQSAVRAPEAPVEPRVATPIEIAQAALDGQIEALEKYGFDQECLLEVKIKGERCLEKCVPRGLGFSIAVRLEGTECKVIDCTCEGEEPPGREI